MARVVGEAVRRRLLRLVNRSAFENDFLRELPEQLAPAARFAFRADWTGEERRLAREIEAFRARIPSLAPDGTLVSLPSPRSGQFALDEHGRSRGATPKRSRVDAHARTGTGPHGGILLRRIASGLGARRILELGTNTGFSGCYLASATSRPTLVTVEGSADLCRIAEMNIGRFSEDVVIENLLFDEAIDELRRSGLLFDCAFIDGQHERRATLHYAERLEPIMEPSGALIFDDIYWSDDMNQAWKDICLSPRFGMTLDLGSMGVAVLGGDPPKKHFDLCELTGRPRMGRPGW